MLAVKTLVEYKGLKLISKYDRYYIRFVGGMMDEFLCDILITNDEYNRIAKDNEQIVSVLDHYRHSIPWGLSYFMDSGIKDYMRYAAQMNDECISKCMESISHHEDIKTELYQTIMSEKWPTESGIDVSGHTAKSLAEGLNLSVLDAYKYLIYLREDPVNAEEGLNMIISAHN